MARHSDDEQRSPSAPTEVSAVSTKLVAIFQTMNRLIKDIACSRCSGLAASKREDKEGAFRRGEAPRGHDFLAVLDNTARYAELFEHDGGERHVRRQRNSLSILTAQRKM